MTYRFPHELPSDSEQTEMLNQIVDALLDSQDRLSGASLGDWDQILRDACREQKGWTDSGSASQSELLECC